METVSPFSMYDFTTVPFIGEVTKQSLIFFSINFDAASAFS